MTANDRITEAIAKCPWDPNAWLQGEKSKKHHKSLALCRDCAEESLTAAVAVAHATGRLNMAVAVERERERWAKVADEMRASQARSSQYIEGYTNGCFDVAAAIRKEKP